MRTTALKRREVKETGLAGGRSKARMCPWLVSSFSLTLPGPLEHKLWQTWSHLEVMWAGLLSPYILMFVSRGFGWP